MALLRVTFTGLKIVLDTLSDVRPHSRFPPLLVDIVDHFLDAIELMFVGIGFITVPIAILLYKRINAKRDAIAQLEAESGDKKVYTNQELRELGDRAPDFRYTL